LTKVEDEEVAKKKVSEFIFCLTLSLKVSFESQSRFSNETEKEDVERGSWEKLVLIRNSSLAELSTVMHFVMDM